MAAWRRTDAPLLSTERMAILELMAPVLVEGRAAAASSSPTTPSPAGAAGLEEDEPGALVNRTVPVNKFPDFVAAMVAKLRRSFP